jgi:hypothetical protein
VLHPGVGGHDHPDLHHAEDEGQQDRQRERHLDRRSAAFVASNFGHSHFAQRDHWVRTPVLPTTVKVPSLLEPSQRVANIGVKVLVICTVR